MWISLIGGEGTCKRAVAEWMRDQEGFRIIEDEFIPDSFLSDHFSNQIELLLSRYKTQYSDCQVNMNDEDIVQIRSFWDIHEVYSKTLLDADAISGGDYDLLSKIYDTLNLSLTPPHTIFYCNATTIQASNRMKLTDATEHTEEHLARVRREYESYVERLRPPVVEIATGGPFDKVIDVVRFGLNSIKSTKLGGQSLWKKTMMKTKPI